MEENNVPEGLWETEKPVTDIGAFEAKVRELYSRWDEITKLEEQVKAMKAAAEEVENHVMATLKEHNMDKFHVKGCGTVGITKSYQWRIPQGLENKKKFFEYLKKRGVFLELISVNSQTLNRFCKEELEIAKGEGKVNWNPDGLEQPSLREKLVMRSK
jgi:hypothetical protein